ncbi:MULTISPECIES: ABC transporter permease [unclassified Halomonas]|uniref:ABC transporter permease n=1 Tax=unclassified Halomonas TaxID=2609666 RepID=UPI004033EA06
MIRSRWFGASKKLGVIFIILFGLLTMTFVIGRLMPIDPVLAVVGPDADSSTYEQVFQQMGLDRPIWIQYFYYLQDMLSGDFGYAILTGSPVINDIIRVLPATIELASVAIIFGVGLGVPLGVYAATHRGQLGDHLTRIITLFGYSTPVFWVGMVGLIIFYAWLNWAGAAGRIGFAYDGMFESYTGFYLIDTLLSGNVEAFVSALRHIALPAAILGLNSVSFIGRMTRSFMLEQLSQEYVKTARVKGLSEHSVIWKHAFKNILVQLLTIVALAYGGLLEGAVLIETVFAWPGFGQYLTDSLLMGDMNAVMASVLFIGLVFVFLNLLSDVLYKLFDPRTK